MIDNIQVGIHDSGNILGPSISIRGIRRSQLIFLTVDVEEIHEKADISIKNSLRITIEESIFQTVRKTECCAKFCLLS